MSSSQHGRWQLWESKRMGSLLSRSLLVLVALAGFYLWEALQVATDCSVLTRNTTVPQSTRKRPSVNDTSRNHHLLLSVPFYVYEGLPWIEDVTVGNMSLADAVHHQPLWSTAKHADDYYFVKAALEHPLRTLDPDNAQLFVAPMPSNHLLFTIQYQIEERPVCWSQNSSTLLCGRQLLDYVNDFLATSPYFQKHQGNDHIIHLGLWGWNHPAIKGYATLLNIAQCHIVGFGETNRVQNPDRLYLRTFYVGNPCPPAATKSHDFVLVATLKHRDRRFRSREHICEWMSMDEEPLASSYNFSVCGPGIQCPALAESKWGFHVRGDSWGANRLFDTLLSGTVPIFTYAQQYDVNPDWIDWNVLSYFADVRNQTVFLSAIEDIVANVEDYNHKQQQVLQNRPLFDWTTLVPFDIYMYMLQARLFPETRVSSSPYTALILPPPW